MGTFHNKPTAEVSREGTTELNWPELARRHGWSLRSGQWVHEDRPESYEDGDWVYLGDGAWDDAYLISLPADERTQLLDRYQALRGATINAARARTVGGNGARSGGG